jgi:hypothetical protein
MTEAIEPGPASIGIAIGKTETSSTCGCCVRTLFGALLAPLGALFEHHVDGDHEQHDPARDAEAVEFDVQRAEQVFAEQREDDEDAAGDQARAHRHDEGLPRRCGGRQPGVDRRAAGRVDHLRRGW